MEKILRAVGLTRTQLQSQHGKWVPVLDTQRSMAIGGDGTGERSPDSVRSNFVTYNIINNVCWQGLSY